MTTNRWGVPLDDRTADMLDEAQRICGVPITCTQGSYNAGGVSQSAGTHDGGGAVDLSASGLNQTETDRLVLAMRQIGFAAWLRTPDQGNWPYHIHAIAGACPDWSSGARDQWNDYLGGRNGLANNAPDDGPRDFHHVGITWEQYAGGGDDMTPEQVQALNEIHYMLKQEVIPQTEQINPRMLSGVDATNWGVNDPDEGLRRQVAELTEAVARLEEGMS